jgi:hypothetical protein
LAEEAIAHNAATSVELVKLYPHKWPTFAKMQIAVAQMLRLGISKKLPGNWCSWSMTHAFNSENLVWMLFCTHWAFLMAYCLCRFLEMRQLSPQVNVLIIWLMFTKFPSRRTVSFLPLTNSECFFFLRITNYITVKWLLSNWWVRNIFFIIERLNGFSCI